LAEKRRRKWGDRRDGRYLRKLNPFYSMIPFVMKTRNDAMNYFAERIEITESDSFLRKKRREGFPGMGILHLLIATYIRVVSQRPSLNRFVSGRRIYARDNIEIILTVKKGMTSESGETTIKVGFLPTDTIDDVYHKLNEAVTSVKDQNETSTDNVAKAFMKLPRVILMFAVRLLEIMDFFGLMPNFVLNASPFHGSMIITDLGSLGIPPVFHHLYNFGNLPLFISFGAKKRVFELDDKGEPAERKYLEYTIVMDERICDGFNYAQAFKYFRYFIKNPEELCQPPEQVIEDAFF
jgi:hypothetical protein